MDFKGHSEYFAYFWTQTMYFADFYFCYIYNLDRRSLMWVLIM